MLTNAFLTNVFASFTDRLLYNDNVDISECYDADIHDTELYTSGRSMCASHANVQLGSG